MLWVRAGRLPISVVVKEPSITGKSAAPAADGSSAEVESACWATAGAASDSASVRAASRSAAREVLARNGGERTRAAGPRGAAVTRRWDARIRALPETLEPHAEA